MEKSYIYEMLFVFNFERTAIPWIYITEICTYLSLKYLYTACDPKATYQKKEDPKATQHNTYFSYLYRLANIMTTYINSVVSNLKDIIFNSVENKNMTLYKNKCQTC